MTTNTLYFGDNLTVLREKIPSESVDLIYIDPPFNSARNYFVTMKDRGGEASRAQEEAFADTWHWTAESDRAYRELIATTPNHELAVAVRALKDILGETPMLAYLVSMALRISGMHRVLKPTGSFYLHCDPTASHYLKILLDCIFGPGNFRNHITWVRSDSHNDAKRQFPATSDHIFFYVKSAGATFNKQFASHAEKTLREWYLYLEMPDGTTRRMTTAERETQQIPPGARRFNADNMTSPNPRPNLMYEYKGYSFPAKGWRYSRETMAELDCRGRLLFPANPAGRIMLKRYLDEQEGVTVGDAWTDISQLRASMSERLGYPTQKPLALLDRIIAASSKPDDIVLDGYCGCGTTVHAAHKLGRRWIGIDIAPVAVAIIKTRMEQAFVAEGLKVPVDGFPTDEEGARTLFEIDPYRFQVWACTLVEAFPLTKKGADKGIDGRMPFFDFDDKDYSAVVQVKGGKVSSPQVRDFCRVIEREKAAMGFFISLEKPTRPMQQEALSLGVWQSAGGREYPRCQLLTIGGLLAGAEAVRIPPQDKRSLLGYRAAKGQKTGQQPGLFEE